MNDNHDEWDRTAGKLTYCPLPVGYDGTSIRKASPPRMLQDPRIARAVRMIERTPATSTTLEDVAAHL